MLRSAEVTPWFSNLSIKPRPFRRGLVRLDRQDALHRRPRQKLPSRARMRSRFRMHPAQLSRRDRATPWFADFSIKPDSQGSFTISNSANWLVCTMGSLGDSGWRSCFPEATKSNQKEQQLIELKVTTFFKRILTIRSCLKIRNLDVDYQKLFEDSKPSRFYSGLQNDIHCSVPRRG